MPWPETHRPRSSPADLALIQEAMSIPIGPDFHIVRREIPSENDPERPPKIKFTLYWTTVPIIDYELFFGAVDGWNVRRGSLEEPVNCTGGGARGRAAMLAWIAFEADQRNGFV